MRSKIFEDFLSSLTDRLTDKPLDWKFINAVRSDELRFYLAPSYGRGYEDEVAYASGLMECSFTDEGGYSIGLITVDKVPLILDGNHPALIRLFLKWRMENGV